MDLLLILLFVLLLPLGRPSKPRDHADHDHDLD